MRIEVSFPGGKRVDASFDGFTVRTDQPAPVGGGTAPSPFDTFLASLATCAGIYIISFCQQRGIPQEGLRLVQETLRDPATGALTEVRVRIVLPDGFPEKYRGAIARAAEQCAVKRLMDDPPLFTVTAGHEPWKPFE